MKTKPLNVVPPLCACGCGVPVNWHPIHGWSTYRVGHYWVGRPGARRNSVLSVETRKKMADRRLLYYAKRNRPGEFPPEGQIAPLCSCGCGAFVTWKSGFGWNVFTHGHYVRKLPVINDPLISQIVKERYEGNRSRDRNPVGPGVYATKEYKLAKSVLVDGKPCRHCGRTDTIHAHHTIPGDDSSLVPLCSSCHIIEHQTQGRAFNGRLPPKDSAPLCACGCGRPVKWKRFRGWAKYCKGHCNAKVPGGTKDQAAPLCQCGCGEPVKFRFGKGWNQYKRGHGQRVEGHYKTKRKLAAPQVVPTL